MKSTSLIIAGILKFGLALVFLIAITKMPYKYYEFVRVAGFVGFIILAFIEYQKANKALAVFWLLSAIVVNPLRKIMLAKGYWIIIDVIWAISLIITALLDSKRKDT